MNEAFSVYCDESCHLERDKQPVMVLGALWCPTVESRGVAQRIRELKVRHGLSPTFEIKWCKVSPAKSQFYTDLVDYFYDDDSLHFRALVVPDKSILDHRAFGQDHDTWYYKMYFDLLKVLLSPECRYSIYLDIKDTRSAEKVRKLHNVLCNNLYDFSRQIIERVQNVRSHEVEQVQLADLLIGALGYAHRGLASNSGKTEVVERVRKRSGYSLWRSTLLREDKTNLLIWEPRRQLGDQY